MPPALASGRLQLLPGHRVELVCNGRVFDVLEEEIARARESIHFSMYIWRPGEVSERLVRALGERARAGVACRILVDAVGSRGGFKDEVQGQLERAGCEVRRFHPPHPLHPRHALVRNHRKIVVVDGRVGVTGGWCVADDWDGDGRHEDQWRDTNVRVWGPAVAQMQDAFDRDWRHLGGPPLPPGCFPELGPEGEACATFVASLAGPGALPAERMLQQLFESARRRLWIASGYFVLNEAFSRLLVARQQAGVDVRILVPGPLNDIPPARAMQRSTYRALLRGGVRLWEYQPAMMHSKAAVVDEHLCVVGSTNMDPFALNVLEEGSLVVEDAALTEALARAFLEDLEYSHEVRRALRRYRVLSGVRRATWRVLRHFE